MSDSIHTLDARDSVMLEVVRDYFGLAPAEIGKEIKSLHRKMQKILAAKGIDYVQLKSGLIPNADKNEVALLFNPEYLGGMYGSDAMRLVLPLLDRRVTQSVLSGDLIFADRPNVLVALNSSVVPASHRGINKWSYCIYLNNLSDAALQLLGESLSGNPAFIGYIPTTFSSPAKTYLSFMLGSSFLKYGSFVLMGHEDDRPDEENVNMTGDPFEEFGYLVRSVQSMYFDTFLSYKIERAVYPGFEVDTEMALSTISDKLALLSDCSVVLDESKYQYLLSDKLGSLQVAGMSDLDREEVASLIQKKIATNYIYNLRYLEEHDTALFNVLIEIPRKDGRYPARMLVALEYLPQKSLLRVVTFF